MSRRPAAVTQAVSRLWSWACYVIVVHWPFGFGDWHPEAHTGRSRIFFALLPYAGDYAYSDVETPDD